MNRNVYIPAPCKEVLLNGVYSTEHVCFWCALFLFHYVFTAGILH